MGRWSGRLITRNPVTPSGPGPTASAPGVWTLPEVAYWNKQGRWPSASADPYWSYVSFLLGTTATNAAQNNTFLDSSTNNFTITRNGNTTQGTFSPYDTLWSNYFDGSGDYLTIPSNTAFAYGTGDFTVEAWVYKAASGTGVVLDYASSGGFGFQITDTQIVAYQSVGSSFTFTYTLPLNSWAHIALVRTSGNLVCYANGALVSSLSCTTNFTSPSDLNIGRNAGANSNFWNGYLSNLRVVKGTAVYTSAFTPPAAPLTAVSGTSLLTCQSNRFRDASTNNFAITRNGDTRVSSFSPFILAPPGYNTADNGGSGYFDGSGDSLYLAGSSAFAIATTSTPFTIECWIYPTAAGGCIFSEEWTGSGNVAIALMMSDGTTYETNGRYVTLGYYNGSFSLTRANTPVPLNTWTHVAAVFTGSTSKMFYNGVDVTASSPITSWATAGTNGDGWFIGRRWDTAGVPYFSGYIAGFRFTNGTAVYTSAFTPPTSPVTAISGTSILCNFTNAGIFDASMNSDMETTGNTQVSTGQAKFGTTSAYFDGSGVLSVPANPAFNFSTGDFTIECWLYPTATATVYLVGQAASNDYAPVLLYLTSGRPGIAVSPSNGTWTINNYVASALTLNTWSHVAAVRYGNKWSIYVNGVENVIAASTAVTPYISTDPLGIGGEATGAPNYPYYGYIDDLRITKGYARYTANFTPPTAALPVY